MVTLYNKHEISTIYAGEQATILGEKDGELIHKLTSPRNIGDALTAMKKSGVSPLAAFVGVDHNKLMAAVLENGNPFDVVNSLKNRILK